MRTKDQQQHAAIDIDAAQEDGRLELGRYYAVVTVSPIYHGRLVGVSVEHYVLENAAWVVETGRLSEFVKDPAKTATEAESLGKIIIERGSVIAVYPTASVEVNTR